MAELGPAGKTEGKEEMDRQLKQGQVTWEEYGDV